MGILLTDVGCYQGIAGEIIMTIKKMVDLDLRNQRVLLREDLNVPIENGVITSDKRITAALPTIELAAKAGARVIVMSHLGQPKEGAFDPALSLAPVAERLSQLLGKKVRLVADWLDGGIDLQPGEVVLTENVRFLKGEKANDDVLAQKMAAVCDIFVMDAFATAHRAQTSTHGVAKFAPIACAGPLLVAEIDAIGRALEHPAHPLVAIVGGSKVSTKLQLLENLLTKVDQLLVGGGIANTFIAAAGYAIGKSLYEKDFVEKAKSLLAQAKVRGAEIPIPIDVVVAQELGPTAVATVKLVNQVAADEMILDIGPQTAARLAEIIARAKTVVWNGPVGVFEHNQFGNGTKAIAEAVGNTQAFTLAGGGDTLAAIEKYGVLPKLSYVSTGGGAFLEFLQGDKLPAIEVLESRG